MRNYSVKHQTYPGNYCHGKFKNHAYYHSDDERNKKAKERKEWLNEGISRYEKNPEVKCIVMNNKTKSAYLYEHYPSYLIDKDNLDREKKSPITGEPTMRVTWHTFVIFD